MLFPHWMQQAPIAGSGGTTPALKEWRKPRVFNRTGGALTVGGIYQFDHFFASSAAESGTDENGRTVTVPIVSTYEWDDPASAWCNIVAPGTVGDSGLATNMFSAVYCVALSAAADNQASEVMLCGLSTSSTWAVKVIGATTQAYSAWAPFRATQAQIYGTMSVVDANAASIGPTIGRLTATYTEATTPAATARSLFFYGFGFPT